MTDDFPQLHRFLDSRDFTALRSWLERESHLPGPRANLSLILAFAAACGKTPPARILPVLADWLATPLTDAPVNAPAEFPVACAAAGIAALVPQPGGQRDEIVSLLVTAARNERWRTREGVVLGAQLAAEQVQEPVLSLTREWGRSGDSFLERAAIAILAHPPLLTDSSVTRVALEICDEIIGRLQSLPSALRKTEGNRVLEKGLSYAISVFVAALPDTGFAYLERWLLSADELTRRIINTNLGKARLARTFPAQVAHMKGIIFEARDWQR